MNIHFLEERESSSNENAEDEKSNYPSSTKAVHSKETPLGILRLDTSTKHRRTPSDIHISLQAVPSSPQPSVDRLSVTFADCSTSVRSDSSTRFNLYSNAIADLNNMDKIQSAITDGEDSEEDYSASVSAIIQRKASLRKSSKKSARRTSSPFSPDILPTNADRGRRRSSVYTNSSGDTAISMDETFEPTEEQIFENIKLHKEVLSSVKMQPWNMRKKLKLVTQAKNYVKKHEGVLQERLTHSRSIKNMLARWDIYFVKLWQMYQREFANLSNWLIPWERRIKEIESHFGSVVASYFTFLRWIFWVNVVMSAILVAFVTIPEMILVSVSSEVDRKQVLPEERYNSTNFVTLWDFEGLLKYSPIFYGWYTNKEGSLGYRIPLAYFMAQLAVYVYSFVATLNKMAENSRMSKLSEKDDECVFTWKLFTGWDYMIGNAETAHNRVMSIVLGFKEALLEEAEKKRTSRNWRIFAIRIIVNVLVLSLFALSAAAVVIVVNRSSEDDAKSTVWRRNETTVVMTLISFIFPMIMEILGMVERYHPRKQLRIQLARIMLLNLLNLYALIYAQFDTINDMSKDLKSFKPNVTPIPVDSDLTSETESATALPTGIYTTEVRSGCSIICNYTTEAVANITVSDLVTVVTTSISTSILPTLFVFYNNTLASTFQDTTKTTESVPVSTEETTTFSASVSEMYENITILNSTFGEENATRYNFTDGFDFYDNGEGFAGFVDILQYYLNSVLENFKNGTNLNVTEAVANVTDVNLTQLWEDSSSLEEFRSIIGTVLHNDSSFDERFDNDLSNLYNEITTSIAALQNETLYPPYCEEICETSTAVDIPTTTHPALKSNISLKTVDSYHNRSKLRSLCWETMFGQELVKLTVLDLVFTIAGTIGVDFLRGVFVRLMNRCWCWDLEKKFPEYGEFKVAENILHLVSNQGYVWMGMFFSPGLVVINAVKLFIMMYLRSWAVLTCNVPHEVIFRASRSNNFYFGLLLTMLFLCVLPVGYAIVWVEPSWHCGPFSHYFRMFHIFTKTLRKIIPKTLHRPMDYMVSPGIVIPLLVLLILIIYYLISLTNSLREANSDLKIQLRQERTEERRKMFQMAKSGRRFGSSGLHDMENTPFAKWKKLFGTLPGSSGGFTKDSNIPSRESASANSSKLKDLAPVFIKSVLKQPTSIASEDNVQFQDDGTDTEQLDSLPESTYAKCVKIPVVEGDTTYEYTPVEFDRKLSSIHKNTEVEIMPRRDSCNTRKSKWQHSPSHSSSAKETSGTSSWSESIPVITISKSDSSESILNNVQITGNDNVVGSSNPNPQEHTSKHVLKKQDDVDEYDNKDTGNLPDESEEEESTTTTVTTNIFFNDSPINVLKEFDLDTSN